MNSQFVRGTVVTADTETLHLDLPQGVSVKPTDKLIMVQDNTGAVWLEVEGKAVIEMTSNELSQPFFDENGKRLVLISPPGEEDQPLDFVTVNRRGLLEYALYVNPTPSETGSLVTA